MGMLIREFFDKICDMFKKIVDFFKKHSKKDEDLKYEFLPSALEIMEKPASPLGKSIILIISFFMVAILIWSLVAKIDVTIISSGSIVPVDGVKVVDSNVNGEILSINKSEGDVVKEGEEIMVAQTVKVVNEQGLHMRPAGVFAKEMTKFSCAVTLDVAGKKINAKSVMLIIAACIKCGAEVTVECDGADEKEALAKAVELIESGFGE